MFQGSMVALVTPMLANGDIDFPRLGELVDWHVESGTDAIVAVGTTGESATLDFDEHCEVIRFVVDRVAKRIPVIAGTGANSTKEALELGQCAKEAGADATLVVTPYYNKPTQEGLYQHYKFLAEHVDLPMILYNVPGRTAVDMLPETVERLAALPGIIGIKEATGNLDRISELVKRCGENFAVYSGDDDLALECTTRGAKGVISVTANVAPKRMHDIFAAALSGNVDEARQLNEPLKPVHADLFLEANPIPVKWAVEIMGKMEGGIRLPLTRLSEKYQDKLRSTLKTAGII